MLYFDHRGMGLSTPITAATVAHHVGPKAADQANFLKQFRADSAVKDLEAIRQCLTADFPVHLKKWSIMGQSYGGFKESGIGKEYSLEGMLEDYTRIKQIAINIEH